MTTAWHSQFLPCDDALNLASALRAALKTLGCTLYDPFTALPGKAYARSARLFVAPVTDGWGRILGAADERLLALLAEDTTVLALALEEDRAAIRVYAHSRPADPVQALAAYLRPGFTPDDLRRALAATAAHSPNAGSESVPLHALPDDLKAASRGLDSKTVQKMFGKLMKKVNRHVPESGGAHALLKSGADWDSAAGRQIAALMACLTVPDTWRAPDFIAVRDAYQLAIRRQRSPNAPLYPGDAEALAAVPDALAYIPVYAGMDA